MDPVQRAELFDLLFAQDIFGVFVMRLDEPITWRDCADRDEVLDYAFDHLRVVLANDTVCRQLGVPRDQLVGSSPGVRWSHARDQWRDYFRRLFDQGRVHHTMRPPKGYSDGAVRDIEGDYTCSFDAQGRITGYIGIQRDVSDVRRMTAELAESQRRLELALASGELGVWDHDLAGETIYFDRQQLARLGYPSEPRQHPQAWWQSLINPLDLPAMNEAFYAHAAGRTPVYHVEYRVRTASGDWAWLQATGKVIAKDAAGRPQRAVGVAVDITERRQLQDQLLLTERLAAVGRLATGVAHEINNPLAFVMLTLELMQRELAGLEPARAARMRALIDRASYGTERVRGVVRDLQSLTRPSEAGDTLIDPIAILERCLDITGHQFVRRAHVERAFAPAPMVRGDEGRMVQVFVNLLINAAQAIPEGAADRHHVRVATRIAADGRAMVEVTDDGAGIPEDVIGRIFDPFFTTKKLGEGTGLGLWIARGIIDEMGGAIEVDSAADRGTTFRVLLPAAAPPPASRFRERAIAPPEPAAAQPSVLRILAIDDEPLIGSVLCEALADHQIVFETSARAALARLGAGEQFDRILCDLMMPEMSGMELYEQLEAADPALCERVVFLTGGAVTERARLFLERVQNRRLTKPFDLAELLDVIQ